MRASVIGSEHTGQAGGIRTLGIAAPFLRREHFTELSATDAWSEPFVGDGLPCASCDQIANPKTMGLEALEASKPIAR